MRSKDFEQKILNYELEISDLEEYLDDDFKEVVTGMINSLYTLFKHPKNNRNLIGEIFLELEILIKLQEEDIKLKLIINLIENLNKKIEASYNNKSKNDIIGYRNRLLQIIQNIKIKQERMCENNITCILRKLIYEEDGIIFASGAKFVFGEQRSSNETGTRGEVDVDCKDCGLSFRLYKNFIPYSDCRYKVLGRNIVFSFTKTLSDSLGQTKSVFFSFKFRHSGYKEIF